MDWSSFIVIAMLETWVVSALLGVFIRHKNKNSSFSDDPRPLSNIGKAVLAPGLVIQKMGVLIKRVAEELMFEEPAENGGENL